MLDNETRPPAVALLDGVSGRNDIGYRIAPVFQDFDFRFYPAGRTGSSIRSVMIGATALALRSALDLLFNRRADGKFAEGKARQLMASCLAQPQESPRDEFADPAPELHGLFFPDQCETLRSVRRFARQDFAPGGRLKSRQNTQKYITKVIHGNLGFRLKRIVSRSSLNWTVAPLLLHSGITSRPG